MVQLIEMILYFMELTLFYHLFDLKVTANSHRSPCLETQKWKAFKLLCAQNQTIYVKHHHIRNVTKPSNLKRDCGGQAISSRGVTLPLNKEITYYSSMFAQTVNSCNNKRECTLHRTYFEKMEESLPSSSITYHLGSLCHSVEYECIPDSEVVQNCTHEVGNEYKQFYLKFLGVKGNFSCQIVGRILGMEILQTHLTGIRISSNGILLYEHQKINTGVYGEIFSLLTNQLTIEVQDAIIYSYILLKVQSRYRLNKSSVKSIVENPPFNISRCVVGATATHVQTWRYSHGMTTENTKDTGFRDQSYLTPLILVSTVTTIMISLLMVLSIIQQQRLLKSRSTDIHVKAADKNFVLRNSLTYGGDIKIEIHNAICMRDQPSKLEIGKKSHYHNSVPDLTEPETNSTKEQQSPSSVKCEAPRGEEELYIDMLPSA